MVKGFEGPSGDAVDLGGGEGPQLGGFRSWWKASVSSFYETTGTKASRFTISFSAQIAIPIWPENLGA